MVNILLFFWIPLFAFYSFLIYNCPPVRYREAIIVILRTRTLWSQSESVRNISNFPSSGQVFHIEMRLWVWTFIITRFGLMSITFLTILVPRTMYGLNNETIFPKTMFIVWLPYNWGWVPDVFTPPSLIGFLSLSSISGNKFQTKIGRTSFCFWIVFFFLRSSSIPFILSTVIIVRFNELSYDLFLKLNIEQEKISLTIKLKNFSRSPW